MKHLLYLLLGIISFSAQATISGCSSAQEARIRESEKVVALRLDVIIREWALYDLEGVKRDFVLPHKRQWVEGSPKNASYVAYWKEMKSNFTRMKSKVDRGLNFQCQPKRDRQCASGDAFAYVVQIFGKPREMIYLCPTFFEDGARPKRIFHELTHYAANAGDYTLDWWHTSSSDLKRGARDAYHIEEFMNGDVREELLETIWTWWWPRSRTKSSQDNPRRGIFP